MNNSQAYVCPFCGATAKGPDEEDRLYCESCDRIFPLEDGSCRVNVRYRQTTRHIDEGEVKRAENDRLRIEIEQNTKQQQYQDRKKALKTISVLALLLLLAGIVVWMSSLPKRDELRVPSNESSFHGTDYQIVFRQFLDTGFTDIETVSLDDLLYGTAHDVGSVTQVSIDGKTGFGRYANFKEDAKVVITYHAIGSRTKTPGSAEELKGKNYKVAVSEMYDAGFTNVEALPLYDLTIGLLKQEGEVEEVSINGNSTFLEGEVYNRDDRVIISYHTNRKNEAGDAEAAKEVPEKQVIVPNSSNHYLGLNYQIVVNELMDAGFLDIEVSALDDLEKNASKKDGTIDRISINGVTSFKANTPFESDNKVRITFHSIAPQTDVGTDFETDGSSGTQIVDTLQTAKDWVTGFFADD